MITLDSRVRRNEEVLFQDLQGEAVLLNLKSGVYFGLDKVGTRIWQLLSEHELLAEVAQKLVEEYEVTEDRCSADLLALTEDLRQHQLVTLENPPPAS
jgi:Coenzyme PQQ synthesis protein D (PqqD)